MELNQNAKKYFYDIISQKKPIQTAQKGKVITNLYYNFIDEVYTIERKTKKTQLKERTKDRQHAKKLFYLFLNYKLQDLTEILKGG